MKTYQVKFRYKDKGISTTVNAENEAMAKQRILSMIHFVEVKEINPFGEGKDIMDFLNGFNQ